jgi:hypothetical protein
LFGEIEKKNNMERLIMIKLIRYFLNKVILN